MERLIAVYFPLKLTLICSKNKTYIVLSILILFALSFYSFAFYTSGVVANSKESNCVTHAAWFKVVSFIAMIDISITTIIPFFSITIINLMIAIKLKNESYFKSFQQSSNKSNSNFSHRNSSFLNRNRHSKSLLKKKSFLATAARKTTLTQSIDQTAQVKRIKSYSEATKTLLIISFMFLILHSPIALDKLLYFIKENFMDMSIDHTNSNASSFYYFNNLSINKNDTNKTTYNNALYLKLEANQLEEIFERIACYIYYSNFSLNFFLYTYNKSKFRRIIFKVFERIFS